MIYPRAIRRRNPTRAELRAMKPSDLYALLRRMADDDPAYAAWMDKHKNKLTHAVFTVQQSIKPHPTHVEDARAYIREAAEHLAAMPPPGPEWMGLKDDVGLSGSTYGPITRFVRTPDPTDADYLGAAEYLRVHARTQLDYAKWEEAFNILKAAAVVSPAEAQLGLTETGRKTLAQRADPGGSVRALDDGRLVLDLDKRVSGARWRGLGLTGVRFDGANLVWVVDPGAVEDAVSALRGLKLDVLADQVEDLISEGLVGEDAVPEPEEEVEEEVSVDPSITTYAGVSWQWASDGRIEVTGLRISGAIMDNVGLRKRKDYQWKKLNDGSFLLFITPDAVDQLLADRWIRTDFRQVDALRHIQAWAKATGAAVAQAVEEKQRAKDEACSILGPIWKAASIAEIGDPKARKAITDINARIRWPGGLKPFDYQQVGIGYAILRNGRAYIGDAMGLGKTLQAIGVLKYDVGEYTPAVVVSPSGVVFNWRDELSRFAPELTPVPVTSGKQALPPLKPGTVLLMSWDMMKRHIGSLAGKVRTAIFDEAHYAKNFKAQRTQAALDLARATPHVLLLSGTPFPNRPIELFPQLTMVDPNYDDPIFEALRYKYPADSMFVKFGQEYADGHRKPAGYGRMVWDFSGASNLKELQRNLSCMMVARKKTQPGIAGQLPPKTRTQLWIPLEGKVKTAYQRAEQSFIARACENAKNKVLPDALLHYRKLVDGGDSPSDALQRTVNWANGSLPDYGASEQLMEIGALLRDVGILKIPAAVDWITDFLESSPDPLVVFVKHKAVLRGIGEELNKLGVPWTFVDGSVGQEESNNRVRDFQAGRYRVIVATEKLREGANLQNAADMLFVERWWVPGYEEQAEGRVHRQGGRGVPVNIRYLMVEGTMDEVIHEMVDTKRGNFEDVFGEEEVEKLEKAGKLPNIKAEVVDALTRDAIGACQFTKTEIKRAIDALTALEEG